MGEIVVEHLEGTGDLDANAVTDLVAFLQREGFLDPPTIDVSARLADALRPKLNIVGHLLAFAKTLRLDWTGADRHVRWWYRSLLRPLFSRRGAIVTTTLAVSGFVAFLVAYRSGRYSIGEANAPVDSVIILALGFVLTYAHELGHALGLVHFDRRIKSAGFMMYFGSPAFFVDASDGLMLERRQRIMESALGPFSEMVLAGFGSFLLLAFPEAAFAPLLYKFTVLNYLVIFENLIPLLELDGYFILAEAIEVPDLRERSLQFIQHDVWHKLRARDPFSKQEVGLGAYAVIGVAFTILSIWVAIFFWKVIFGTLVSALWNGGIGSRLLLLTLALFVTGPAIRGLITLARTMIKRLRMLWRKIRFRFETSWRVEAARMIDALPAFDELPEDVLSDLAGRVRLVAYRPGAPVFRQGDRPDAFYVVRNGTLRIEEEHPDTGDTVVLRTLIRGDSFGELGLLQSAPRAATVRAESDAEVFAIDEADIRPTARGRDRGPDVRPYLADDGGAPRNARLLHPRHGRALGSPEARSLGNGDTRRGAGRAGRRRRCVLLSPIRSGRCRPRWETDSNARPGESLRRDRAASRRPSNRERLGADTGARVPPRPGGFRSGGEGGVPPGKTQAAG